jgi:hypothetical protein
MSRVLACAGQFAHVDVKKIDGILSDVYRGRFRDNEDTKETVAEAASDDIVRLYRAGAIPMMFNGKGTLDLMEDAFGVLCPLCQSIDGRWQARGGAKLSFLVSPFYLALAPEEQHYRGALCGSCFESIHRVYGDGPWWTEDRQMMISAIASLLTRDTFRKRVHANRNRKLRFDPRRMVLASRTETGH